MAWQKPTISPVHRVRVVPPGWTLELQSDFRSAADGVEFRQSNFGNLGLRVAKSLSVVFGGGKITGADCALGERELFGKTSRHSGSARRRSRITNMK